MTQPELIHTLIEELGCSLPLAQKITKLNQGFHRFIYENADLIAQFNDEPIEPLIRYLGSMFFGITNGFGFSREQQRVLIKHMLQVLEERIMAEQAKD